jgi:hypothetical protein
VDESPFIPTKLNVSDAGKDEIMVWCRLVRGNTRHYGTGLIYYGFMTTALLRKVEGKLIPAEGSHLLHANKGMCCNCGRWYLLFKVGGKMT